MAEKQAKTKRRPQRDERGAGNQDGVEEPEMTGPELAKQARRELAEITGMEPESVTALERGDDGTWTVTVELLELSRIPSTDDVLGSYEAKLSQDGELLGYRRLRRYSRAQADQPGPEGG